MFESFKHALQQQQKMLPEIKNNVHKCSNEEILTNSIIPENPCSGSCRPNERWMQVSRKLCALALFKQ